MDSVVTAANEDRPPAWKKRIRSTTYTELIRELNTLVPVLGRANRSQAHKIREIENQALVLGGLVCPPKSGPGVMRVPGWWRGLEVVDGEARREASYGGADRVEAP